MEESDKYLLFALQSLGLPVPKDKTNIQQLNGDNIKQITIKFLKKLGKKTKAYKNAKQSHNYRIANQLCSELRSIFGGTYDLTLFIQPNPSKAKKLILSIVSKLSQSDDVQEDVIETQEEIIASEQRQDKKKTLDNWLKRSWILPQFSDDYNCTLNSMQISNLKSQCLLQKFKAKKKEILYQSLTNYCSSKKQSGKKQGKFSRKKQSQQVYNYHDLKENNLGYWTTLEAKIKKAKKAKAKKVEVIKDVAATNFELDVKFKQEDPNQNQIQNQNQDEDKDNQNSDEELTEEQKKKQKKQQMINSIDDLKKEHKQQILKLQNELNEYQTAYDRYTNKIEDLEEVQLKMEEQIENLTATNKQKEKNAEELHKLAKVMEKPEQSKQQLVQRIDKIEENLKDLDKEWEEHRENMLKDLKLKKLEIEQKKLKMEEQQAKIIILQNDIENLGKKMRANKQTKQKLQKELKRMPKGVNRQKFVKKINDIHSKLKKQREDLQKSQEIIKNAKVTNYQINQKLNRSKIAIENVLNLSTKDKTLLAIRDEYRYLQQIYNQSVNFYDAGGQAKLETQQVEIKIDALRFKNYATAISNMKKDLQSLKQENKLLRKKQKK